MTRTEFVKGYAKRSKLSDRWAAIGIVDIAGICRIALPCACGSEVCPGWAMLSADGIDDHLRFSAPNELSVAYIAAADNI